MNHHNMFFNMLTPYFQLLKKWGVLALFGKIGYGVLLCKRHKLKNIYEIYKNDADYTNSEIKDNDGPQKIGVICRYLDHCGRLKKKWASTMNSRYYPLSICTCINTEALGPYRQTY